MNPQIPYGINPNMNQVVPNNYGYNYGYGYMENNNSNLSTIENKLNELEQRIQKLENKLNMTSSVNFKEYQSSMYMM